MENFKELYFLGLPIETEIGTIHFLKIKDYHKLLKYIPYLNLEKSDLIELIAKTDKEIAKTISEMQFVDIIKELKTVLEIYANLQELFFLCFQENVFKNITTDEQFEYYKNLIRDMNCINYEKKNPNPEIQRFIDYRKLYDKQKMNCEVSLESMVTSVWLAISSDVMELTIYQMYALFNRLTQFKNYDTTVLYSSVSGDVKIDPWYKHVSMTKNDTTTSLEEFSQNAIDIVGG